MVWFSSSPLVCLALASVALAVGCAGGPWGDSLQRSLEADPQLQTQFPEGDAAMPEEPPPASEPPPPVGEAEAGDNALIGPVLPAEERQGDQAGDDSDSPSAAVGEASLRLDEVPTDLRPYVQDWLTLGQTPTAGNIFAEIPFQPSRTLTRGAYAHWLFAANNLFYSDQPSRRIRPGSPNSTPAFQDVPIDHPHFITIQGLAEAGIIPSALTGNATAVTFRPEDALTRENLVLWKVPLDTRTVLPMATVEAVQVAWGFQDAADIEPLALRAVLADRQTGDFANILRAFGFTTLFQPRRAVSQAEAAAVLWRFGHQTEGVSVEDVIRRDAQAETASPR